jgi:hypothetical protein
MWLAIICALSFAVGILSFKAPFSRRIWINICTPLVLTFFVVVIPALITQDKYDRLWRLISIFPGVGCGIMTAFLSEIPIAIFAKRQQKTDEHGQRNCH